MIGVRQQPIPPRPVPTTTDQLIPRAALRRTPMTFMLHGLQHLRQPMPDPRRIRRAGHGLPERAAATARRYSALRPGGGSPCCSAPPPFGN